MNEQWKSIVVGLSLPLKLYIWVPMCLSNLYLYWLRTHYLIIINKLFGFGCISSVYLMYILYIYKVQLPDKIATLKKKELYPEGAYSLHAVWWLTDFYKIPCSSAIRSCQCPLMLYIYIWQTPLSSVTYRRVHQEIHSD